MIKIDVLDKGFVRLVDVMGSDSAIVDAARVSYGGFEEDRPPEKDAALIDYLMRHDHGSPFEMVEMKFHVKAPLFVTRQWFRHRTASVNEVSGRYTVIPNEIYIPDAWRRPDKHNKQGSNGYIEEPTASYITDLYTETAEIAFDAYERLLAAKVAREQARMIIPLGAYTEFYWKQDLRNLLHFLKLRLDPHAQYEIRQYAEAVASFVRLHFPMTWEAFVEHKLEAVILSRTEWEAIKKVLDKKAYDELIKGLLPRGRYREAKAKIE